MGKLACASFLLAIGVPSAGPAHVGTAAEYQHVWDNHVEQVSLSLTWAEDVVVDNDAWHAFVWRAGSGLFALADHLHNARERLQVEKARCGSLAHSPSLVAVRTFAGTPPSEATLASLKARLATAKEEYSVKLESLEGVYFPHDPCVAEEIDVLKRIFYPMESFVDDVEASGAIASESGRRLEPAPPSALGSWPEPRHRRSPHQRSIVLARSGGTLGGEPIPTRLTARFSRRRTDRLRRPSGAAS